MKRNRETLEGSNEGSRILSSSKKSLLCSIPRSIVWGKEERQCLGYDSFGHFEGLGEFGMCGRSFYSAIPASPFVKWLSPFAGNNTWAAAARNTLSRDASWPLGPGPGPGDARHLTCRYVEATTCHYLPVHRSLASDDHFRCHRGQPSG